MSDDISREERRRICMECSALIDMMDKCWPVRMPSINANDRELGALIGERRLIDTLKAWRDEAAKEPDGTVGVIRGSYVAKRNREGGIG